jgi:hypothetical protein
MSPYHLKFSAVPPSDKYRVIHIDDEHEQLFFAKTFLEEADPSHYKLLARRIRSHADARVLNNTEELKVWEEKNKQYNKNIEETKKMQNEIRDQLKVLIEQQVKGRYASAVYNSVSLTALTRASIDTPSASTTTFPFLWSGFADVTPGTASRALLTLISQ